MAIGGIGKTYSSLLAKLHIFINDFFVVQKTRFTRPLLCDITDLEGPQIDYRA